MRFLKHIVLLGIIITSSMTFAQVNFEVKVDKNKIAPNEPLKVSFEMNKEEDSFIAPTFEGFDIIDGPNKNLHNAWVAKKHTFKKTITYYILPKTEGRLTIGEASAEINYETYKTKPITITVSKQYKYTDKKQDSLTSVFKKNVHLVTEVSNKTPNPGDSILVIYKLYVSQNVGIKNWKELEKPEYKNFEYEYLKIENMNVENGSHNEENYRYVVWRKTKLLANKKGTLSIEPLTLNITAEIPTNKKDIFGGTLMKEINRTLSTDKVMVTVN